LQIEKVCCCWLQSVSARDKAELSRKKRRKSKSKSVAGLEYGNERMGD